MLHLLPLLNKHMWVCMWLLFPCCLFTQRNFLSLRGGWGGGRLFCQSPVLFWKWCEHHCWIKASFTSVLPSRSWFHILIPFKFLFDWVGSDAGQWNPGTRIRHRQRDEMLIELSWFTVWRMTSYSQSVCKIHVTCENRVECLPGWLQGWKKQL